MDKFEELINSIGALAEMVVLFRRELESHGVPDGEICSLTRAFLHEILSNNRNKEDN
jgi:predicted hydrocarbon binding protein